MMIIISYARIMRVSSLRIPHEYLMTAS